MFSDRCRVIKIGGILFLLILLAWYSNRRNRYPTFADCLREPGRYAGEEISIYMEPRVIEVTGGHILISQPDGPVEVRIPEGFDGVFPEGAKLSDLEPGDSLEAVAVFRLPGYLELKAVRGAPLRRWKILLSILPVILVGLILLRTIRWRKGFLVMLPDTSSDASDRSDVSDESGNFKL